MSKNVETKRMYTFHEPTTRSQSFPISEYTAFGEPHCSDSAMSILHGPSFSSNCHHRGKLKIVTWLLVLV